MPKRKDIARFAKDINNGTKVLTGHDISFFVKMAWEAKGKEMAEEFLRGGRKQPMPEAEDWRYSVLGTNPGVPDWVLKIAYLKRARETHPDYGGNEEECKLVNQAYDELKKERGIK